MSIVALNHVRNLRAGGFAQSVLLYLADAHNAATGKCCPSREKIAEFFSSEDDPCTVKRVDRALAKLRNLGLIRSTREKAPNGVMNMYSFPGLEHSSTVGGSPHDGVDPTVGCSPHDVRGSDPQWGQWVAPTVGAGTWNKNQERTGKEIDNPVLLQSNVSEAPEKPKRKRAAPKRRIPFDESSRLPDDWREDFEAKYPTLNLDEEFDRFVSWHQAKGTVYADWKAAFRNWLTNALRYAAQKSANNTNGGRRGSSIDRNFSYGTLDLSQFDYTQ